MTAITQAIDDLKRALRRSMAPHLQNDLGDEYLEEANAAARAVKDAEAALIALVEPDTRPNRANAAAAVDDCAASR